MSVTDPRPEQGDDEARAREQARLMALKIVVIVLGAILVLLALVVFSTLIWRAVKGSPAPTPPASTSLPLTPPATRGPERVPGNAGDTVLPLPAGSRVVSTAVGEGKLAVTVETAEGFTTILLDQGSLREVGRIRWQVPR